MGQDAERQVPACRVAAKEDVGGAAVRVLEDVAQRVDGLAELGWVDGVGGEGVREEEDGDVVVCAVGLFVERCEKS